MYIKYQTEERTAVKRVPHVTLPVPGTNYSVSCSFKKQ